MPNVGRVIVPDTTKRPPVILVGVRNAVPTPTAKTVGAVVVIRIKRPKT